MRQNYTCIGGCFDIDGFSLIRFDLVDQRYRILKTSTGVIPTYDGVLSQIENLAASKATIEIETIDVLCNFGSSLKNYIIQNHKSEHAIRIKTTQVSEDKENMILNLINALCQKRVIPDTDDTLSITALEQIESMNKERLKNIYEGNETLNQVLEAILHSVSWLEGQMIKHRMI